MTAEEAPATEADPLEAAWQKLDAEWDEPRAHEKFIALASTLGRLPDAGAHYKEVRDKHADPARRESARKHIDALFGIAMRSLGAMKTEKPKGQDKRVLFIAFGIAIAFALYALRTAMEMSG